MTTTLPPHPVDLLIQRYPLCFAGAWDVSMGDGWVPIIDELCAFVEPVLAGMPVESRPHILQVKEKFGGLRVYMSEPIDIIERAIRRAEVLCAKTCELCGAPGTLGARDGSTWISTLCEPCRAKPHRMRFAKHAPTDPPGES